jgi:cytochrome c oxidase subunit II
MKTGTRYLIIAGVIILAAAILFFGTVWIARTWLSGGGMMGWLQFTDRFGSNGERIYMTGTSASGPAITAEIPGMHRMRPGRLACSSCHGPDGRGGQVWMMMSSFDAPDIRYSELTDGGHGDDHEHPPYTDEDIRMAISEGIRPDGELLEWMMPRWSMTGEQLDDLIAFLKTLE